MTHGNGFKDLSGQKFGRWTVIAFHAPAANKQAMFWCQCECGMEKAVNSSSLRQGDSLSCGCYKKDKAPTVRLTHGATRGGRNTTEYSIWRDMLSRCFNKNRRAFKHYGGRGITVCERWMKFENFFSDMGVRPSIEYSLERVDNDGIYEPGNVKWGTRFEQVNNRRNNVYVTHQGRTKALGIWAAELGIAQRILCKRIQSRGWAVERAFTQQPRRSPVR